MGDTFYVEEIDPDHYDAYEADSFRDYPIEHGTYKTGAEAKDVLRALDAAKPLVYTPLTGIRHSAALDPFFPVGYAIAGPEPAGVTMATASEPTMKRVCRGAFTGLKFTVTVAPTVNYTTHFTRSIGGISGSDTLAESGSSVAKLTLTRTGFQGKLKRNHDRGAILPARGNFTLDAYIEALAPSYSQSIADVSTTTQTSTTSRTSPLPTPTTTTTTSTAQAQYAGPSRMEFFFLRSFTTRTTRLYFRATAAGGTYYNASPEYSLWLVAPLASGNDIAFYEMGNYDSAGIGTWGHIPPSVPAVIIGSNRTTYSNVIAIDEAGPSVFGVATRLWGWRTEIIHNWDHDDPGSDQDEHDHGTEVRVPTVELAEL